MVGKAASSSLQCLEHDDGKRTGHHWFFISTKQYLSSFNAGMFFRAKFWNMRFRMKLTEISAFEPAMPSLRSPQNELTVIDTKLLG